MLRCLDTCDQIMSPAVVDPFSPQIAEFGLKQEQSGREVGYQIDQSASSIALFFRSVFLFFVPSLPVVGED